MDAYTALLQLAAASPIVRPPPDDSDLDSTPSAAVGAGRNGQPQSAAVPDDPDPLGMDRAVCESVGLDVLGETIDRAICVFAQRKRHTIPKIAQFKYPDLLQICGPVVRERVNLSADAAPPGTHHFERVREAIAVLAGQQRLYDYAIRGAGIWPGEGGRLVLVGSGEAAIWNPAVKTLTRETRPKAAGLLLDLDSRAPWYAFDELAADLKAAEDPHWREAALDDLYAVLSLWNWKARGACSLLAGLVLATWLQTAWRWRPHVALTGESVAGKSTFLTALAGLFGPLAHLRNKPSEAGLRQSIQNRACAILIDEFESDYHRRRVLELLRTSGTGSRIVRGSTSQTAIEFGLRHICWIGAIEVGTDRQPDANRYLTLEVLLPSRENRKSFRLPTDDALAALGHRLVAVAIWSSGAALEAVGRLQDRDVEGLDPRTRESLAVPTAALSAAMGLSESAAGEMMDYLAGQIERGEAARESDQAELMHAILASTVLLEKGQHATVAQLLGRTTGGFAETFEPLERVGIAVVTDSTSPREFSRGRTGLFLDHKTVRRYLLADTQWKEQSIDTLLLRLSTARRRKRRISGRLVWGVEFEWLWFEERFLCEEAGDATEASI